MEWNAWCTYAWVLRLDGTKLGKFCGAIVCQKKDGVSRRTAPLPKTRIRPFLHPIRRYHARFSGCTLPFPLSLSVQGVLQESRQRPPAPPLCAAQASTSPSLPAASRPAGCVRAGFPQPCLIAYLVDSWVTGYHIAPFRMSLSVHGCSRTGTHRHTPVHMQAHMNSVALFCRAHTPTHANIRTQTHARTHPPTHPHDKRTRRCATSAERGSTTPWRATPQVSSASAGASTSPLCPASPMTTLPAQRETCTERSTGVFPVNVWHESTADENRS